MAGPFDKLEITPQACRMARAGLMLRRRDLAERAGLSPETIMQIEVGRVRPHQGTIDRLLRAFASAGVVFGGDGSVRVG